MTRKYTTHLAKGQGMISETMTLLSAWEPGISVPQLKGRVVQEGILSRATALRAEDIVGRVFASRYLSDQARPARQLKVLLKKGVPSSRLNQLFLVYTARANPILHDFITHVYWAKYATGASQLTRDDSLRFVREAAQMGLTEKPWSETMRIRVARYLLGCLTDFNLAGPDHGGRREILPLRISSFTTIYLAHDLHFSGCSDSGLLDHRDWKLFGLEKADVLRELQNAAAEGHFIPQSAGDLLRISWKHKTMEECLCALS